MVLSIVERVKHAYRWDEGKEPIVFLRKKREMATEGQKQGRREDRQQVSKEHMEKYLKEI
jgi:hypothetical protein